MTLDQYRDLADRLLAPFVAAADRLGLSPDGVSVVAFGFAVAAGGAFYLATPLWYALGALFVFANGWLDLVDGALARAQGVSSEGGDLLDHVLDRYADIAMLVGLAAGIDGYALGLAAVTGVLMTSYLGTQIQAVGLGREYGGLVGRADRLALIGVAAVVAAVSLALAAVPVRVVGLSVVGWLLVFFAVVGHLTALQRFWGAWSDLS
ncbi:MULTISPECIES: CDP-alcohol phosphatidyltransferase family protein [Halobellus]|uniref:CDP-alcohol phosphatidyltransferase family protein n=1 Tax=Halobellus TaxID=1073986 RepID=UPI000EF2897A|nr:MULTISPECIES: CDP-alcohol phosphatidyltransferase family protein [Halobellus]MDQ2053756.1 CDP-alcohol phosphatidyltransferase family protein [Halobellus sp. H-GB7]RLM84042.1 CDP-alcohol phosphatidyltransferase family protein [Halobellus sp. Atlit-38R]